MVRFHPGERPRRSAVLSAAATKGRDTAKYARRGAHVVLGALVLAFFFASPSTAQQGPARWDKPVLTVHVADEAAWAKTDVQGALTQWAPVFALILTDDADADVTLSGPLATDVVATDVGATATLETSGSRITGCRVGLAGSLRGSDVTGILTHELGHCLGLSHSIEGPSVMFFSELGGSQLSSTVTAVDVAHAREMYR